MAPAWTCPECGRGFARTRQAHECAPAMDLEEYFATGPPWERPVFEAVLAHVATLGPVTVEPVSVGIFVKGTGSWLELRPLTRWVALSFPLDRRLQDRRMTRKPIEAGGRWYHYVNLRSADDVDDQLRQWLTESYLRFG